MPRSLMLFAKMIDGIVTLTMIGPTLEVRQKEAELKALFPEAQCTFSKEDGGEFKLTYRSEYNHVKDKMEAQDKNESFGSL